MRTAKFRAWYEQSQKFVYIHIGEVMTDVANAIYSNICLNGGKWYQFTGLLDKNGVEIYEGDVLEYTYGRDNTFSGIVEYHIKSLLIGYENVPTQFVGFILRSCPNTDQEYFTEITDLTSNKVIGNIHENPELLLSK